MDYLKQQVKAGTDAANKHYNAGLQSGQKKANEMHASATKGLSNIKSSANANANTNMTKGSDMMKAQYNKQKYKNPSNFIMAKGMESRANSMYNRGSQMTGQMSSRFAPTLGRFNPKGMTNKNVEHAVDASSMGSPQASQYSPTKLASRA